MKDRIQKFMKSENLSPSQLADNIGVQRSGVSHIISGRNKPGLEFVQRILKYYPNLNPDWLLINKGSMYRNSSAEDTFRIEEEDISDEQMQLNIDFGILPEAKALQEEPQAIKEPSPNIKQVVSQIESNKSKKEADKIIILYKDGSFDIYN